MQRQIYSYICPAAKHHGPLTGTKLHRLVTQVTVYVCVNHLPVIVEQPGIEAVTFCSQVKTPQLITPARHIKLAAHR